MSEYRGRRGEELALNHFINSIVVEQEVMPMMIMLQGQEVGLGGTLEFYPNNGDDKCDDNDDHSGAANVDEHRLEIVYPAW